ncbi:MAG TPA: outer membrane beta-barrel protein [Kofleriaceae bacterium]|nr:outer membrane beta-barrel protein [Kofleriaceae bacterium]
MKLLMSVLAGSLLVPALAHAQDASIAQSSESNVSLGASLQLLPIGTLAGDSPLGGKVSTDTASAFAIGALGEIKLDPTFSIGFAPRYIFNVKSSDANDSAAQVDLAIRVTAGGEVAPNVRLYGFAAPGYSFILPPSNGNGDTQHPNGAILGFGGGVAYTVAPKIALTGELGYQLGFQSFDAGGTNVELKDNYLQIGFGLLAAID